MLGQAIASYMGLAFYSVHSNTSSFCSEKDLVLLRGSSSTASLPRGTWRTCRISQLLDTCWQPPTCRFGSMAWSVGNSNPLSRNKPCRRLLVTRITSLVPYE